MSQAIGANHYLPFDMTVQVWKQALGQVDRLSTGVWDTVKKVAHIALAVLLTPGVLFFDLVVSVVTVVKWFARRGELAAPASASPSFGSASRPFAYNPGSNLYLPAPSAPDLPQEPRIMPDSEVGFIKQALEEAYAHLQRFHRSDRRNFYQELIDHRGTPSGEAEEINIYHWLAKCYVLHFLYFLKEIEDLSIPQGQRLQSIIPCLKTCQYPSKAASPSELEEHLPFFRDIPSYQQETLILSLVDLEARISLDRVCLQWKRKIEEVAWHLHRHPPFLQLCKTLESRQN